MVKSYTTLRLGNEINKIFLACPCLNINMAEKVPWKGFFWFYYLLLHHLPSFTSTQEKKGKMETERQILRQHGDLTTLNYLSSDNGKIRELLEKWKKEITIACYHVGYRLPRNETTHIISEDRPIRLVKMTQNF